MNMPGCTVPIEIFTSDVITLFMKGMIIYT